jgi:hypothetical protein
MIIMRQRAACVRINPDHPLTGYEPWGTFQSIREENAPPEGNPMTASTDTGADTEVFSLNHLLREVWDELGGADYHILAHEVLHRLDPAHYEAALGQALAVYTSRFVGSKRMRTPHQAGQQNSGRSAKVRGIRTASAQLRTIWYATPDGQKALGDCTLSDVFYIVGGLERQARQHMDKARWLRGLAEAMTTHPVRRVQDLPAGIISGFFTGAEQ